MTVTDRLRDVWRRLDVTVRDAPLAVLLAVAPLVPGLQHQGTRLGTVPDRPLDALGLAAVALQALPLVVRRRLPRTSLAVVAAGFAIDQLRGYHTVTGVALVVALVSGGAHVDKGRRATVALATAAYAALATTLAVAGASEGLAASVTFFLVTALAWGVGAWYRQARAAEAAQRRLVAERTRTAERARIAADLHDVVTHHVTAMVVQAEAARYRTGDDLAQTLTAVTDTGRRALADLRHLLDVLDPGHGPSARTPAVGEVRDLVDAARAAGQPVELVEEGAPAPVPGGAHVAAYRVVQEALTNALKHARGSATTVHVRHGEQELHVRVTTTGSPDERPGERPGDGGGRGLVGLAARVDAVGGTLHAGPRDGAFVVEARLPGAAT